jgi:hypothetical protein
LIILRVRKESAADYNNQKIGVILNMKRKLLPITLGLALMATAGTAYAQSVTNSTYTDTQKAAGSKHTDKAKIGWYGYSTADNAELLALLTIDEATLKTELKAGKTLAAIGEAKGITKQQIIDLLVKQETALLDKAVADGKLTQAEVDTRKTKLLENITKRVDQAGFAGKGGKGPEGQGGPGGKGHEGRGGGQGGPGGFNETLTTLLGVTAEEIGTQLKAGKSLSEIALEKGISKQTLIDALVKKETERITKQVDEKRQPKPADGTTPAAAATK